MCSSDLGFSRTLVGGSQTASRFVRGISHCQVQNVRQNYNVQAMPRWRKASLNTSRSKQGLRRGPEITKHEIASIHTKASQAAFCCMPCTADWPRKLRRNRTVDARRGCFALTSLERPPPAHAGTQLLTPRTRFRARFLNVPQIKLVSTPSSV